MKKILSLLSFSALCLCASVALIPGVASAQERVFAPQAIGVPATMAAATTTNFVAPLFIDASKQDKVAFQFRSIWTTAGEATGSTNLLYKLAPTVDGVSFDTNKPVTLASYNRAASAGFTNIETTNLTANGLRGWYIYQEVNNSAGGVATNTLQYGLKIGAP